MPMLCVHAWSACGLGEGSPKRNWYAVARNYDTIRCEQFNLIRLLLVAIFFVAFRKFLFTYFALFKSFVNWLLHTQKNGDFFWFFLLNLVSQLVTVLFPQCCCCCWRKLFLFFTYLLCLFSCLFFSFVVCSEVDVICFGCENVSLWFDATN